MFRTHARKIVLALALMAAAGSLLPIAQPAEAAAPETATADTARIEVGPVKPRPDMFKFSIRENGFDKSGATTHYHFKLQAELGTLRDVKVKVFTFSREISSNDWRGASPAVEYEFATLGAPDYRTLAIVCTPKPYEYCDGAEVGVTTSNAGGDRYVNDTDGNKIWPGF